MTTNQPSSLAEIKERISDEFYKIYQIEEGDRDYHTMVSIDKFISSTIDQSYELGRSVGRAELLSEIKGVIADSEGDVTIVLAGLLNKLRK
jgi:hypothetical protein